jgi:hypothetical protein
LNSRSYKTSLPLTSATLGFSFSSSLLLSVSQSLPLALSPSRLFALSHLHPFSLSQYNASSLRPFVSSSLRPTVSPIRLFSLSPLRPFSHSPFFALTTRLPTDLPADCGFVRRHKKHHRFECSQIRVAGGFCPEKPKAAIPKEKTGQRYPSAGKEASNPRQPLKQNEFDCGGHLPGQKAAPPAESSRHCH